MTDQSGTGVTPDARFQSICQAIDQELKRLPIPGAVFTNSDRGSILTTEIVE